MRGKWRRFTAFMSLWAQGGLPKGLNRRANLAFLGVLAVVVPLFVLWTYHATIRANAFPSYPFLGLTWLWIAWMLAGAFRDQAALRAKGYDAGVAATSRAREVAIRRAARMGNLRTARELIRLLPSRDELAVTPLFLANRADDSIADAIFLLADTTRRNRLRERREARRRGGADSERS